MGLSAQILSLRNRLFTLRNILSRRHTGDIATNPLIAKQLQDFVDEMIGSWEHIERLGLPTSRRSRRTAEAFARVRALLRERIQCFGYRPIGGGHMLLWDWVPIRSKELNGVSRAQVAAYDKYLEDEPVLRTIEEFVETIEYYARASKRCDIAR